MPDSKYKVEWVTDHLAVGGAPLCCEHLDQIREQGISAIMNLCAEYCDLHEIERDHGFDVYYLPTRDENVPQEELLEKAMEWMDGILRQDRRLLIHCRWGIGRTGTLLYAYLWSRNLQNEVDDNLLRNLSSRPACFLQWRLVERYRGSREPGSCRLLCRRTFRETINDLFCRFKRLWGPSPKSRRLG